MTTFNPGDRVRYATSYALFGINNGDTGTIHQPHNDYAQLVLFDKHLEGNPIYAPYLSINNGNLRLLTDEALRHRARIAWQRGDYDLL